MISRDEVRELAQLARIALTDDEQDALRGELTAILDHVAALAAVDTAGVEPMTHAVPMDCPLRPDELAPSLPAELAVAAAPRRIDDFFELPRVIEEK